MDFLFLFKKIAGPFLFPVPLCLIMLILGLILLWFTRKQKTGKVLVTLGVAVFGLLSYSAFSDKLLRPLEYSYPPKPQLQNSEEVKWVVVLGGGHTSDPQLPLTSQIDEFTIARLVEGIRLKKMLPESKLLLSGGPVFDPVPHAMTVKKLALAIGVDRKDIALQTLSRDTKDEARIIKNMVGNHKFILVTSASHLPRSMALFRKQGMNPISAPTDHLVKESQGISPSMFFPSSGGLRKAERAFYEYLGLVWAKMRGQV